MRKALVLVVAVMVLCPPMPAQTLERITVDTVFAFYPGSGQSTGQGSEFFPSNISGIPDPRATISAPSADPREICSIGLNGEIIVGFKGYEIVDGPGADFIIFENAFVWGEGRYYREPARVEVSEDGFVWTPFPFDSLTLVGCAGRTPTTGNDPFDASVSGGDAFDLSDIGVHNIRWIKLVDVTKIILDNTNHPDYDPTLTGFDLDAVVSTHGVRVVDQSSNVLVPRTASVQLNVSSTSAEFEVFDVSGRLVWSETLREGIHIRDLQFLPVAVALTRLRSGNDLYPVKVLR